MLSKEDLQSIKEIVDEAINSQSEETKHQMSAYDRYNKAARLFEDKIHLLDALAEVVKIHSKQIIELKRKQAYR